jgi:peroxiredoxin
MEWLLLGARLALAGVLGVAGVAKLTDPGGTRSALAGFGVPATLTRPGAWCLPLVELALAALLLMRASAWTGAVAAFGLLLLFTAVLGRALARGEQPSCGCFGQLGPAPVNRSTLVRNGVLLALAGLVVAQGHDHPGPGVEDWLGVLAPGERVLAILSAVAVGLLVAVVSVGARLLGQQVRLADRLDAIEDHLGVGLAAEHEEARPPDAGLPIGAPAPAFELPDLDGISRSLASFRQPGRPVLLLFVELGCDPCVALVPEIARWQQEHEDTLRLVVVSRGAPDQNRARFGGVAPDRMLLQTGADVAAAYAAEWMPAAVLIGADGRLGSVVAYGDAAIRTLVSRAAASSIRPVAAPQSGGSTRGQLPLARRGPVRLGDPAPPLARKDLDGRPVDLADYRGRDTLVVFWQPACPHCQRLAEDLRRWEAEPPLGAPRLLLVSSGSADENRALGLRSSVVLDEGFTLGKAFGARATPSAVLVDAEGRIASAVGVGARDVLALAGIVPLVVPPDGRSPSA